MSGKTQKQDRLTFDPHALESASKIQQNALEGVMGAGEILFKWMDECNREWTDFLALRVGENVDTQRDLWACRSPADAVTLQSEFVRKAVEGYSTQVQMMLARGTEVVQDELMPILHPEDVAAHGDVGRARNVRRDLKKAA